MELAIARRPLRPAWLTVPLMVGGVVVLAWVVVALTIPAWAPYDPLELAGHRLRPPDPAHLLGTDALGRDVLTRTLYGARISIPIAAFVVAVAAGVGSLLGALAGFFGGLVDTVIMRLVDVTLSFPAVLLAMAVSASLGPGLGHAAIAMVLVWWPIYARLMRAQVLEIREREHVEAARAIGVGNATILFRHILALCWTPVIVNTSMDFGQVVLLAASLSFIGLGAAPPTPEWGVMISEGAQQFYSWWIALGPGMAILTFVLGMNFVGDGLRDLLDPRSR
jgi:peptide/nickel transport system permease protein